MSAVKRPAWTTGIPLAVDVKKIEDAFGVPEKATLIPYEKFERALDIKRAENRFTSVVTSWRRQLFREHNLVTEGIRGEGVMVLDDDRRVDHVGRKIAMGARAISRAHRIAVLTDDELCDEEHRSQLARDVEITDAILVEGRRVSKSWTSIPGARSQPVKQISGPRKVWAEE